MRESTNIPRSFGKRQRVEQRGIFVHDLIHVRSRKRGVTEYRFHFRDLFGALRCEETLFIAFRDDEQVINMTLRDRVLNSNPVIRHLDRFPTFCERFGKRMRNGAVVAVDDRINIFSALEIVALLIVERNSRKHDAHEAQAHYVDKGKDERCAHDAQGALKDLHSVSSSVNERRARRR